MIFKGELSRYHPADILMFLSHLGSNGILSITHDSQTLTVTLKDGKLVDAHSARTDEKTLRILFFKKIINNNNLMRLNQIKQETGMPVSQILQELKIEMTPAIREACATGIKEALLEYFLLESGEFNFTDVVVDTHPQAATFDCRGIALEIASQVDEWRDIEKNLFSLESRIRPTAAVGDTPGLTDLEKAVVGVAAKNLTTRQVIQLLPYSSYRGLKAVEDLYERKLLDLQPPVEALSQKTEEPIQDALFIEFKRAFKKIVSTGDILKRLSAVVAFCKNYFEQILILTARELHILQCTLVRVRKDGTIQQKKIKQSLGRLDQDPGFYAVHRSGIGFLGNAYASNLLKGLIDLPSRGECAIIPVGKQKDIAIMLYVVTGDEHHGLNAFHYLELLSWLLTPQAENQLQSGQTVETFAANPAPQSAGAKSPVPRADSDLLSQLVEKIEDLPPLPALVFQILDLLADPEFAMDKLEKLLGQDQSLVAKLIKVSNSVLYGGVGDINSLREALTRLGTRTVKSLVLTTSTRTFFPKNQSHMGIWSQLLWQHAVECGLAARCIARKVGFNDPDEAFVGGVLHDLGKLIILLKFPEQYRQIQKMSKSEGIDKLDYESQLLGFNHTVIGEKLMKKWKMPTRLKDCVQLHHRFKEVNGGDLLIPIVAYGNCLSHAFSVHAEINQIEYQADMDYLVERLQLPEARNADLQNEVKENFQNDNLFD